MSYAHYFSHVPFQLPAGFGVMAGAYLLINVYNGKPAFYTKQLSKSEYNATPLVYLKNPEWNQVAFPKVPGQSTVPDGLAELHHKAAHAKRH